MTPTKRPWKLYQSGSVLEIQDGAGKAIVHWAGFDSAWDSGHMPYPRLEANAKLIVEAVNAYKKKP